MHVEQKCPRLGMAINLRWSGSIQHLRKCRVQEYKNNSHSKWKVSGYSTVDRPPEITIRGGGRARADEALRTQDDALRSFKLRLNFAFCLQASTTFYRDCKILKIIICTLYICLNAGKMELLNLITSVCRYSSIAAESPPKQTLSCFLLYSKSALIFKIQKWSLQDTTKHIHTVSKKAFSGYSKKILGQRKSLRTSG